MIRLNENFLRLQDNYLFSTIKNKVEKYKKENPDKKLIKLGIGDVTLPIPKIITEAMKQASDEMCQTESFRGYGPEQGYEFLREKIQKYDYKTRGIHIDLDEIFVSDGAKCDIGNIGDIFSSDNVVAIPDPVYPVYLDTNVIAGRSGEYDEDIGMYYDIVYMNSNESNKFEILPEELNKDVDIIYLCSPNNPTGIALSKEILEKWVNYAKIHNSIILYDAAYEAFIQDDSIPHSIYEIEDAKKVAIEFKSFSKTAGFTGVRCAYAIVPKELEINKVSLNTIWKRRQCTKFNGVSYVIQRAAEAAYTEEAREKLKKNINYYKENAKIILKGLKEINIKAYGGENAPYIWMKIPGNMKSWDFFEYLLREANVIGTPGVGFGIRGEGFFRLTAFGDRNDTIEAVERIKKIKF